jgi:hypothetical protein
LFEGIFAGLVAFVGASGNLTRSPRRPASFITSTSRSSKSLSLRIAREAFRWLGNKTDGVAREVWVGATGVFERLPVRRDQIVRHRVCGGS